MGINGVVPWILGKWFSHFWDFGYFLWLKRFFINIDNEKLLKQKTAICYQSTSRKKINFKKKQKIISFVGKLNSAKGYDLFGKAALKILNEFMDWKVVVFGDEHREKILKEFT